MKIRYIKPIYVTKFRDYLKLSPIYLLQKPAGYDLRLYGLMPLIGLGTLIKRKRIEKEFFLFIFLFLFSSLLSLYAGEWLSVRRSIQTLCMAGFCSYLVNYFSDTQLNQLARNSLLLLATYHAFDLIFGNKSHVLILQTWHTYFLVGGLLNNANYTGLLSAGLTIFFALNKEFRPSFLAFILTFLSQSKTAFLFLLLTSPVFFIPKIYELKLKTYAYIIFSFIFLFPLILIAFELIWSEDFKLIINTLSGTRYSIQLSFLELFKANPLGTGYDRSHELIAPFMSMGSTIVENGLFKPIYSNIGAHNTYLKILVELGIFGYFLYMIFIFLLLKKCLMSNLSLSIAFIAICASQLFLEGLNEFIFYFYIALVIRQKSTTKPNHGFTQ